MRFLKSQIVSLKARQRVSVERSVLWERRGNKWATKTRDNEVELLLIGGDGGSLMFCCGGEGGDEGGSP